MRPPCATARRSSAKTARAESSPTRDSSALSCATLTGSALRLPGLGHYSGTIPVAAQTGDPKMATTKKTAKNAPAKKAAAKKTNGKKASAKKAAAAKKPRAVAAAPKAGTKTEQLMML